SAGKIIFVFVLILCVIFFMIHNTITPVFFGLAEAEAIRLANRVINQSVERESEKLKYTDLVHYTYNDQGDITMMQPDIKYVNSFISRVSYSIQQNFSKIDRQTVSIPITRVLGIELLAGLGPDVEAKIIPVGFTRPPRIEDTFTSAGINQTRHKIYLDLIVELKLIVPFSTGKIDVPATVPVTEVVILGRVPRVYIGVDGEGFSGIMDGVSEKSK
ncbi:MAG: sporulation protein YunB, partial [Halanaerobiaceae bacterium]